MLIILEAAVSPTQSISFWLDDTAALHNANCNVGEAIPQEMYKNACRYKKLFPPAVIPASHAFQVSSIYIYIQCL